MLIPIFAQAPLSHCVCFLIALVGVLGTGVSRHACLRPTPWLHRRPGTAHLQHQQHKTLARAKPREANDAKTSGRSGLLRLAPDERRFLCKPSPCEARMTQAMLTKDRWAPAGAVQQVTSLVLKRQAEARSPEESTKGFHFHATRPRPPGWQDGGHCRAHHGVTTRSFAGKDHLSSG